MEKTLQNARAEESALPLGQPHIFLLQLDLPPRGIQQAAFHQLHVVVPIDQDVLQADFSVEDGQLVQVLDCVDQADEDFPD